MGVPWPIDDDSESLNPRQRKLREQRLAREHAQRQRLLNLPQSLVHAIEVSPCEMAHLRDGDRYFVVSGRVRVRAVNSPHLTYTLAFTLLPGDGIEDVKQIKVLTRDKAKEKLRAAGVPVERPIWLPVHDGNCQSPYALPDIPVAIAAPEPVFELEPEYEMALA